MHPHPLTDNRTERGLAEEWAAEHVLATHKRIKQEMRAELRKRLKEMQEAFDHMQGQRVVAETTPIRGITVYDLLDELIDETTHEGREEAQRIAGIE